MAATRNWGLPPGTAADPNRPRVSSDKHGRSKKEEAHYELPSAEAFREAGELFIYNEAGDKMPFKQLYENKPGTQQLIVFIRHFFDNHSEEYVRTLSRELPPVFLAQTTPKTNLTIIGCGDMGVISQYRLTTTHDILGADKGYAIYADPKRELYNKLGMLQNLNAPNETTTGVVKNVVEGVKKAASVGTSALSGGSVAQNGGEMLIADEELVWFKRMRHTQDHVEIAELRQVLGLT